MRMDWRSLCAEDMTEVVNSLADEMVQHVWQLVLQVLSGTEDNVVIPCSIYCMRNLVQELQQSERGAVSHL